MRAGLNGALRKIPIWVVWVAGMAPALWLVVQLFSGALGADPVRRLEHDLGLTALQFLVAALAVTPLLRLARVNLMRFRRALGLLAFVYVVLHLLVWLVLDTQLRWDEIWRDILKRPYITVGMAGFVLMIPLAWTSRDSVLRRMGAQAWKRLHLLAYPATFLGALHFLMVVKAWPPEPIAYLAGVICLLALRIYWRFQRASGAGQAMRA